MAIGKAILSGIKAITKTAPKSGRKTITQKFGKEASKLVSQGEMTSHSAFVLGKTVRETGEQAIKAASDEAMKRTALVYGGVGAGTTIAALSFGLTQKDKADKLQAQTEQLNGVQQELDKANAELAKRQEELEKAQKEAQEAQNALEEKRQEDAEKTQPQEYTVKKGDCFWNIAKDFLINEVHKDEQDYKPTNQEILDLATKFMEDNSYEFDENKFNSEPPLYPGDKLNLAA